MLSLHLFNFTKGLLSEADLIMSRKKFKLEYLWKDRKRHLGLPLSFTRYKLTNDRLFIETGFLNIVSEEILLYRIRDISLKRNLGQRLFRVGTVKVISSDKTCPEALLKNIKNSEYVKELIHKNVEEMKINRHVRISELSGDFNIDDDINSDDFDDDLGEN